MIKEDNMLRPLTRFFLPLFFCAVSLCAQSRGGAEPAWVNDPYRMYDRDRYVAAVGFGKDRAEAEQRAFTALAAVFGQSVRSEFSMQTLYTEAVVQGLITVSEDSRVRDSVHSTVSLDMLVGAETGNVWDNARGLVYALAYLEKEKAVSLYVGLIRENLKNIENLIAISAREKNTFNGYARYKLASAIAAINSQYIRVVSLAGGTGAVPPDLKNSDYYVLAAEEILKNITVLVRVQGDKNNRVQDAFAKVLTSEGLRTRGTNPPYMLEVKVSLVNAGIPNSRNLVYCGYTVSANLVENSNGVVHLPFSFSGRVGHQTYTAAENIALLDIEQEIGKRYPVLVKEYLSELLPEKRR